MAIHAPRATYRLQLNRDFTFAHATELVPYLAALGVSHVYLSPYFKARAGSTHGYDIVDHNALNPEIGGRAELDRLCATLRAHGMGQVLDIVPNHVGVLGADNAWWRDVLENGRAAAHASFFDIAWDRAREELRGKLLLPVLGERYGSVLERGEIALAFDPPRGEFEVRYFEHRFPVDPQTHPAVLAPVAERLQARLPEAGASIVDEFESLVLAFGLLPKTIETSPARKAQRQRDKERYKQRLAELCARSEELTRCIEEELQRLNGRKGDGGSFDALHELIAAQPYRLASWRMAAEDINYRRFCDINELAGVRMEDPAVFEAAGGLLLELIAARQIEGLRVDHLDGLYDPLQYLLRMQTSVAERLQTMSTPDGVCAAKNEAIYLVVEKITMPFESIPAQWPVAGSSGYDFANLVNGLFVDSRAESKLTHGYFGFLRERPEFDDVLYRSKKLIMTVAMGSELNALARLLAHIAQADRASSDFTSPSLRAALIEVAACLPVYRTYVTGSSVSSEDRRYIEWAVKAAKKRAMAAEPTVFDFIHEALTTDLVRSRPPAQHASIVDFAMKFQQFSAPVMAKGMEDTAFYVYNRLVSLNEVGGHPRRFGVSVAQFHHANSERAKHWPHAMLATSTHDSKRSEDVRARIDVLSELPAEWRLHVARWRRINRSHRHKLNGLEAPSRTDEYLIYQTLIGAWPGGELEAKTLAEFRERIERYVLKVVREAKIYSSWLNPNEAYEASCVGLVRRMLTSPDNRRLMEDFLPFHGRIAWFGMLNSLTQTLLKLTAPGVPDIYQGCERWNLSLVDPDNRRAVDHAANHASLQSMQSAATAGESALIGDLLANMQDGRIKQFVTWRVLAARREHEALFRDGAYVPLATTGTHADHLCAFARLLDGDCAVVVAPRLACTLLGGETVLPIGADIWGDTRIVLANLPPQRAWRDAVTGAEIRVGEAGVKVMLGSLACREFPGALLIPVAPQ
jgi:(1->4)-alpha-D-glucan 1-alpha-D-glucosylmutase